MSAAVYIRIRYCKSGNMKYVGHLDTLQLFLQALRRTGLPVSYTQGFHPHIAFSCGPALPLYCTSDAEYIDVGFAEPPDVRAMPHLFAGKMAEGMEVISCESVGKETPKKVLSIIYECIHRSLTGSMVCGASGRIEDRASVYSRKNVPFRDIIMEWAMQGDSALRAGIYNRDGGPVNPLGVLRELLPELDADFWRIHRTKIIFD